MQGYQDEGPTALERAEEKILEAVQNQPVHYSPNELVTHLKQEGLPEEEVSVALWDLIDRRALQVSEDWRLDSIEQSSEELSE